MRVSDRRGPLVVLGVDPGAVDTGLVVRCGDTVLAWEVVHRHTDETGHLGVGIGPRYLTAVAAAASALAETHHVDLSAVEGVKRPNPHVRGGRTKASNVIDPTSIIATALVAGYLLGVLPRALIVPPGRNGSAPLAAYPPELVTDGERRHGLNRVGGSSQRRHARSAYDVAAAGLTLAHLQARKHA